MVTVKSKQSFKNAVLTGEDEIKVEDPQLAKWIVIIHGIKQFAWAVAIVSVAVAIAILIGSGGTGAPASALVSGPAAIAVGSGGIAAMVGLGVTLGGVAGLVTLRNRYRIKEKGSGFVVIKKKA